MFTAFLINKIINREIDKHNIICSVMEYYAATKKEQTNGTCSFMLNEVRKVMLSERSSTKRECILWIHLYEILKISK